MSASNSPIYIFNSSRFLTEKKFSKHGRRQCLGEEILDPAWRAIQQEACRSKMGDQNARRCDQVMVVTEAREGFVSVVPEVEGSGSSGRSRWFARGMASRREFAAP